MRLRHIGNNPRKRGLSRARRSPEDDGLEQVAFDGLTKRLARRKDIILSQELVERSRAHALGERRAFLSRAGSPRRLPGRPRIVVVAEEGSGTHVRWRRAS